MRKNVKIYFIIAAVIILGVVLFWQLGDRSVDVKGPGVSEDKETEQGKPNPITGLKCENYNRRPVAVMLATDLVTRPLSGISQADLVIEMPVVTNIITRLMAVYVCESPEEIGSVRSSRHDYIPLAMGLDAIFAHWGGSHFALDKLDAGIMDNIDAMINPYNAYWQKSGISMPHNGFTSFTRLLNAAEKLGYRLENKFEGYPHLKVQSPKSKVQSPNGRLIIGYPGNFRVYYEYNPDTNSYLRWRGNIKETDKNNGKQVEVSVIAVMRAASRMIELPEYNDVDIEGTGEAIIFQNGEEIRGTWKKEGRYQPTKLYFLDEKGKEIKFTPGKIWIEIVEPYNEVKWETF